ncbi:DUF4857 domain-containing protein [uncultured Cohaesibacter sp.]|uniref:DUF4857 domain-containing protein n=1 Tax=uncultured Cohaesibacter sp. TaxID=1002546 RepID=UPI0029306888|nr:DUF4857 domain-containing protein [uncultured Cohaesibacter sp.]
MSAHLARFCSLIVMVFLLALWLPQLHGMIFDYRFGKTQLLYSPVIKKFIYKELVGEGHQFIYRDQDGKDYSQREFEMLIPFIYYKNMEIWGKMPLEIDAQRFDKAAIKAERLVLELKPVELKGHSPRIQLFPLLESNPGRARLSFPENIVRPGKDLSFINSDENKLDDELTETFTNVLTDKGFQFPVLDTFGRVSILKAFDAGYFLIDSNHDLFHLLKRDGQAKVERIALPDTFKIRHISVAENKSRQFLAIVLDEAGRLYLMRYGSYDLVPLALPDYDPDSMELKIIFNPLYRTAIYSDQQTVHAVVMDRDFNRVDSYERKMAMANIRPSDRVWQIATPFSLPLHDGNTRYLSLMPRFHGWLGLIGNALCLAVAFAILKKRAISLREAVFDLLLVALTGLYGLIAILMLPLQKAYNPGGGRDDLAASEAALSS